MSESIHSKLRSNLLIFCFVALACGWLGLGVDQFISLPEGEETPGMAIWLIAPLLVVIFLRTFRGDGWKDAGLKPAFNSALPWYAVAVVAFPAVTFLSISIARWLGLADVSAFSAATYFPAFLSLLAVNIGKNIFEESVWRGYLTAKLIRIRLSDLQIYLIAGLVWGLWHLPYYLAFLPEADMQVVLPVSRVTFAVLAVITMLFWSVFFTELFRLSCSIWPLVLVHAMEDAVVNHLIIDGHVVLTTTGSWIFSPICGIFSASCYLLLGLWLRRLRMNAASI